ncbi:hypothetical protein VE02_06369 [Pseudogymnoascus sp. 03VT05]|nr:hypothetical protein VE02_06369 [Pseudogymnoascus sp. 03VT05]
MAWINLDGIVAHVRIAMIAMLESAARPGSNILLPSATWHGSGQKGTGRPQRSGWSSSDAYSERRTTLYAPSSGF